MGLISTKLRSVSSANGDKAVAYYCPGCKGVHVVWHKGKVAWDWNGDADKPTLSPSIRIYMLAKIESGVSIPEKTLCHCFVKDGNIEFLSDCAHKLAGQTVPIPEWPHAPGTYGGIDE
jgi:hypothetical protein